MNLYWLAAAVISVFVWALHTFVGGPATVPPLLRSEMRRTAKYTNYYCWHLVTLSLAFMGAGFLYAAGSEGGADVAFLLTGLAISYMVWSIVLVIWKQQPALSLPQWALFLPIGTCGLLGFL